MTTNLIDDIVTLWARINPVAGYTSGHASDLTGLVFETPDTIADLTGRIHELRRRLDEIDDPDARCTAAAVLTNQLTQLHLARPSGAGPSGTGAGGVYAAADGVFYAVLKGDGNQPWVEPYLQVVNDMVAFETKRWYPGTFTAEVRKECLDTATYLSGTLDALTQVNGEVAATVGKVSATLEEYRGLFTSEELASADFEVLWEAFERSDEREGPSTAEGYPATLQSYYTLGLGVDRIGRAALDWLQLDLPITRELARQVGATLGVAPDASLQTTWDAMSSHYAVDFTAERMQAVLTACNDYGRDHIIGFTAADDVRFSATPDYLVNLVTGGEDFAVNYLTDRPFSQLYLTASKNTSLLTMINILVHEVSHGFNFVMSAREAGSPLYNLNTSLEVPMTEGQAFQREYQYYAAAASLLDRTDLSPTEEAYLDLYGADAATRRAAVVGAGLETWIWRVIRYIRALCDVRVNGGTQTYTEFIRWASDLTGLSAQTLHGECFTFLAAPGYAPCYAMGGAVYGQLSTAGYAAGVDQLTFNTRASAMGFHTWPLDTARMRAIAGGSGAASC